MTETIKQQNDREAFWGIVHANFDSGDEGGGAFVGGENGGFQDIENGTRVTAAALALGTRVTASLVDPVLG